MKNTRPEPVPTDDTRPYWDGARAGVLRLPKCRDCGRIAFPPKPICPDCRSATLDWTDLSGAGTMKGWSQLHIAAIPGREPPVTLVEVALLEDDHAVVVALDPDNIADALATDSPLTIGFEDDPNGWSFPVVRP